MTDRAKAWEDLLRRQIQRAATVDHGFAIMSVRVLIRDGIPVLYGKPSLTALEPGRADIDGILRELSDSSDCT